MFGRSNKEIVRRLEQLERKVDQQSTAHSALMNQMASLHEGLRVAFDRLHERMSFNNRPKP
ncbi:hypothetical protein AHiyo6_01040 [Arthrobacter sp. Hiyo6]|nr:hypothetical protein AHiyo6_01040 [Arthrobacter sp. Hiyo6]